MQDLNKYLVMFADRLDREGKQVCANALDELIQSDSLVKLAQYVGVIGYVLKQHRAMGNCIRKKRVASNQSMQEVVLECLQEYQDGQDYHDTEWHSKYAQVITGKPSEFDILHLDMLAQFGKEAKIDEHIKNTEKVAVLLQENGVQDEVINKVLSHIEIFGDILRKEAVSHRPFKVAATPASPRSNWSRFWTPSEFNWWNPLSWRGRWQRGEVKDTQTEMSSVLEHIRSITLKTQSMKTTIVRLKNQVAGYLRGSGQEVSVPESQDFIRLMTAKIDALNPDNWNESLLASQQLRYLLETSNPTQPYNQEAMQMAFSLVQELYDGINTVYDDIRQIQQDMNSLRHRSPIRGEESGLLETGQPNPFGMASPAEEFGVLEQILRKLYVNPFDDEAQHYAQKMHAKLDDRLRYIQSPLDEGAQEYLTQAPEMQDIQPPGSPSQAPEITYETPEAIPETEEIVAPATPAPPAAPAAPADTEQALQDMLSQPIDQSDTPEDRARYLGHILNILKVRGVLDDQSNALNTLINQLMQYKPVAGAPVATSPKVEPPGEPVPVESGSQRPKTQRAEPGLAQNKKTTQQELRAKRKKRKRRAPGGLRQSVESAPHKFRNIEPENPMPMVASIFDIIKVADALDKTYPELADLLDEFIKEQTDFIIQLPRFPENGTPIKEKGDEIRNTK